MSENLYPLCKSDQPVCDQMKTPLWILGMGVGLLRQYFGSGDRIAVETGLFKWSEDAVEGDLWVDYADNFNVEVVGKRPAIIVGLGEQQFEQKVVGDRLGYDPRTGAFSFLDRTTGTLEFSCIAEKQLQSTALATEVKYFLQTYRQPIARTYGLDQLRVAGIGRHQKQKEYQDVYGRVITAAFALQDNFAVGEESLRASAIQLGMEF